MSLFKKPKALQKNARIAIETEPMDVEEEEENSIKQKKKDKDKKDKPSKPQKSSLLSFGDEGIWFGLFVAARDTLIFIQLTDDAARFISFVNNNCTIKLFF